MDELRIARISPEELKEKLDTGEGPTIVDVRSILEYESEPQVIPGALYVSLEELERELEGDLAKSSIAITPGREVVLYCN